MNPLVSIIVTTRNNEPTIATCLESIVAQTYANIELIVVDNRSSDATKTIARGFTKLVFDAGPERSAQRNFGASKANGAYILIIDSDMELNPKVVEACVEQTTATEALIIPEISFGRGFWAACKSLERSFYVGATDVEAARFFNRELFLEAGGYNESMTGGEDWELTDRIAARTSIGRIDEFILHNEGHITLKDALRKRLYYNQGFMQYYGNSARGKNPLASVLRYYRLYFSQPGKLLRRPLHGAGMLFMKTCEFGTGALSMLAAKVKPARASSR